MPDEDGPIQSDPILYNPIKQTLPPAGTLSQHESRNYSSAQISKLFIAHHATIIFTNHVIIFITNLASNSFDHTSSDECFFFINVATVYRESRHGSRRNSSGQKLHPPYRWWEKALENGDPNNGGSPADGWRQNQKGCDNRPSLPCVAQLCSGEESA